jgi:hypothetical protein
MTSTGFDDGNVPAARLSSNYQATLTPGGKAARVRQRVGSRRHRFVRAGHGRVSEPYCPRSTKETRLQRSAPRVAATDSPTSACTLCAPDPVSRMRSPGHRDLLRLVLARSTRRRPAGRVIQSRQAVASSAWFHAWKRSSATRARPEVSSRRAGQRRQMAVIWSSTRS